MRRNRLPEEVIPAAVAEALDALQSWFVLEGQAVRCLCPYRPSRDVDFGVASPAQLEGMLIHLRSQGKVELLEQSPDTVHLIFEGYRLSIFVLAELAPFTAHRRLELKGLLATKLSAILGRGARRDFFDLYVLLQQEQLGLAEALATLTEVYHQEANTPLMLRALTYFEEADREAPLPGEGKRDWEQVKDYLLRRVGELLLPPSTALEIQANEVDLRPAISDENS